MLKWILRVLVLCVFAILTLILGSTISISNKTLSQHVNSRWKNFRNHPEVRSAVTHGMDIHKKIGIPDFFKRISTDSVSELDQAELKRVISEDSKDVSKNR